MTASAVALIALVVLAWGLLATRLRRADLSGPIVFVAGLAIGNVAGRGVVAEVVYVEQTAGLVSLLTWLLFGAVVVPAVVREADWPVLGYALLSLTVIRMLPVALALSRSGFSSSTVAFIGWFGPRGLACVIFAVLALEELRAGGEHPAVVIGLTVLLSVFAHGLSARPLAARYGRVAEPGAPVPGRTR